MNKLKINSLIDLKELNSLDWNNPYTQRQFILNNEEQVDYLIKNYKKNVAYGFDYKNGDFTVMFENGTYYIRDNKEYYFRNRFDRPPVTKEYALKSNFVDDIIMYAIQ
jgi:hypothetical protein